MAAISFARGIPSPELLPVREFGECARAVVERDGGAVLNYGPPGGYGPLRDWIAERHGVAPERVVVTNGSLQGFNLVAEHVLGDGGTVVVEAPTYDRTLSSLRRVRADVTTVPLVKDGLDVDLLADELRSGNRPKLLYTIPTFQNPTGRTLSLERRHALADLVAEHELLVYEDDPYGAVRFEGEPLPTLHELTDGDRVMYSSSFSKTVAPGIRVGYLVLPEEDVAAVESLATETYLSPTMFVQGALLEFLRRHLLEEHLGRVRAELRSRRDAMLRALERGIGERGTWNEPEGGYFIWLELPGVDVEELAARGAEAGVTFVKGSDFYPEAGGDDAARLAFSFASVPEIDEGISVLGRLVREAATVAA